MKLKENDPIFDGFCHRGFREEHDGWMNGQADADDYPAVRYASDVLCMLDEINALRYQLWHLKQERDRLAEVVYGRPSAAVGEDK